jgi:hypothetical protein
MSSAKAAKPAPGAKPASKEPFRLPTDRATVRARKREIARRYKTKSRKDDHYRTPMQWMAKRRFAELMRIMHRYYPNGLPHNGVGYKFAKYVCRTLAFDPIDDREQWLNRNAQWLDAAGRAKLLRYGPCWYGKRPLGDNLELHDIDRRELDIRTIEAFDVTPEQRKTDNLKNDRERQDKKRRQSGVRTRKQYLAACKSQTKPWLADGYKCRRTWERHKKALAEGVCRNSNPSPFFINTQTDVSCDSAGEIAGRPSPADNAQPSVGSVSDGQMMTSPCALPSNVFPLPQRQQQRASIATDERKAA